jgi:threonyl-tRNA synthetase
MTKVPYMIIIGEKEATEDNVSLRKHSEGDLGSFSLGEVVEKLDNEIKSSQATFEV